jgi:hypothetical protein
MAIFCLNLMQISDVPNEESTETETLDANMPTTSSDK